MTEGTATQYALSLSHTHTHTQQFCKSSLPATFGAPQTCSCTVRVIHRTPEALSSTPLRCPWIPLGSIVILQVLPSSFLSAPMAVLFPVILLLVLYVPAMYCRWSSAFSDDVSLLSLDLRCVFRLLPNPEACGVSSRPYLLPCAVFHTDANVVCVC